MVFLMGKLDKVGGLELEAIYLFMADKIIQSPNETICGGGGRL